MIESALASPRPAFGTDRYPSLAAKAAALTYSLSKSQACRDGNKRVALILLRAFLHVNGTTLTAPNVETADMILDAAASDRSEREETIGRLTAWLDGAIAPRKST